MWHFIPFTLDGILGKGLFLLYREYLGFWEGAFSGSIVCLSAKKFIENTLAVRRLKFLEFLQVFWSEIFKNVYNDLPNLVTFLIPSISKWSKIFKEW